MNDSKTQPMPNSKGEAQMTNNTPIFAGETLHYIGPRHTWNNGFRRRWLAMGERDAAVINAARRGDLDTVLVRVKEMGGVRGGIGIARSIIKAAQKIKADVPGHKVIRHENGQIVVYTPHVSWRFHGDRQIGIVEWEPMFGARAR